LISVANFKCPVLFHMETCLKLVAICCFSGLWPFGVSLLWLSHLCGKVSPPFLLADGIVPYPKFHPRCDLDPFGLIFHSVALSLRSQPRLVDILVHRFSLLAGLLVERERSLVWPSLMFTKKRSILFFPLFFSLGRKTPALFHLSFSSGLFFFSVGRPYWFCPYLWSNFAESILCVGLTGGNAVLFLSLMDPTVPFDHLFSTISFLAPSSRLPPPHLFFLTPLN